MEGRKINIDSADSLLMAINEVVRNTYNTKGYDDKKHNKTEEITQTVKKEWSNYIEAVLLSQILRNLNVTDKLTPNGKQLYNQLAAKAGKKDSYFINFKKSIETKSIGLYAKYTPSSRSKISTRTDYVSRKREYILSPEGGRKDAYSLTSSLMDSQSNLLEKFNKSSATILVNTASIYGMNDITHLGIFDISFISNIPNMVYLAPTSKNEYFAMLDWSIEQNSYPVAIRIPGNGVVNDGRTIDTDYSNLNQYKVEKSGSEVAILALGDFYQLGEAVVKELEEKDIHATLINPRYITGLDTKLLDEIKNNHKLVITLEDGILDGGFGEKIASYYGSSDMLVKNYGIKKAFYDRYDVNSLLKENRLTKEQITEDILNLLK